LEPVLEEQLGEGTVVGAGDGGEVCLEPGRELAVLGQCRQVDRLLDARDRYLVEGGDSSRVRVGEFLVWVAVEEDCALGVSRGAVARALRVAEERA
jgi:hypothetical protein